MRNALIPTINAFTGKKFASNEERDLFMKEQAEKNERRLQKAKEQLEAKKAAKKKLKEFLLKNQFSEEEASILSSSPLEIVK